MEERTALTAEVYERGKISCPICKKQQFSILFIPEIKKKPENWPSGCSGLIACDNCQKEFFVKFSDKLSDELYTVALRCGMRYIVEYLFVEEVRNNG